MAKKKPYMSQKQVTMEAQERFKWWFWIATVVILLVFGLASFAAKYG